MNYTIDVGPNVETIGLIWLALHYILPLLFGLFVVITLSFFLVWFIPFIVRNPINWRSPRLPRAGSTTDDE